MKVILTGLVMTILVFGAFSPAFASEQITGSKVQNMKQFVTEDGMLAIAAPLYTTELDPSLYLVPPGGSLDGVADLLLETTSGTIRCTGSLLESDPAGGDNDTIVLTAAHCVDLDGDGVIDLIDGGTAKFEGAAGDEVITINEAWTMVHPDWDDGPFSFLVGNDIAIIELDSAPSSDITRYVYDTIPGDDLVGDADQVGYGLSGFLATGTSLPSGDKRAIVNDRDGSADATSVAFGPPAAIVPGYGFVTDGDSGLPANDACAVYALCAPGLGNGASEGLSAPGDSGGPSYALGAPTVVMGVTSWGGTFIGDGSADVDDSLNSSHGELAVYTRVSVYSTWITETLTEMDKIEPAPEPEPEDPVVAGELLPLNTTALFVSGIFGSALWMAPLAAGIAGTGYYLVKTQMRKQN